MYEDNDSASLFTPDVSGKRPPRPTDDELGFAIIQEWNGDVAYFRSAWQQHQNGVWSPKNDTDKAIWNTMCLYKASGLQPTNSRKGSVKDYLQANLEVADDLIDCGENYLNLQNGLLNLKTHQLEVHQRERYLTSQLNFAYDSNAECPSWIDFLLQCLVTPDGRPDNHAIALLQEAFGYSLTADTQFETAFWLFGPAASGKSTTLKVLQALLGAASVVIDFNMLEKQQYGLANLAGKRIAICTESKSGAQIPEHLFKMLISGESMEVRPIYRQPYTIRPTLKLWWAMNELPANRDRSDALYRRLKIIPFGHATTQKDRDLHLIDKLLRELPGILNWALEGLQRLYHNQCFTLAEQVQQASETYRAENDKEAEFLNDTDWCLLVPDSEVSSSTLYNAYNVWCEITGHKPKTSTKVAGDWVRLGLTKYKKGSNYYQGIQLKQTAQQAVQHRLSLKGIG